MADQIMHDLTSDELADHLRAAPDLKIEDGGGHGVEVRGDAEAQHNSDHDLGDGVAGTRNGWFAHTRADHESWQVPRGRSMRAPDPDLAVVLATVAGDPAPAARAAARVLRHLPELLRDTRTRRGLTLRQAGGQIGVSDVSVLNWERGKPPGLSSILQLLDWIGGEQHA